MVYVFCLFVFCLFYYHLLNGMNSRYNLVYLVSLSFPMVSGHGDDQAIYCIWI